MPPEEDNDKTLAEKQEELVIVESEVEGEIAKTEEIKDDDKEAIEKSKVEAKTDEDDDDEEEGDKRASSEAEAEADAAKKKKDRESSAERRARQRDARERLERELRFYQQRNEQLERRFSDVEAKQVNAEKLTIAQAIEQTEAQLREAKRIEAEAIKEADGASAVEARDIAMALENKRQRLLQAKAKAERPPAPQQDTVPPPAMAAAFEWIRANKDWYDPKMSNEDSVLASAIEDRLFQEGRLNPASPDFWSELDRRLKARGIGKKQDVDEDEDEDDNASSHAAPRSGSSKPAGERTDARTKPNGGPKVSVNGANRALKANEVYVSPERKAAMIEMGIWDDPVLKQKMLRDYQKYDREAAAAARR